jgi:hypothetical protein
MRHGRERCSAGRSSVALPSSDREGASVNGRGVGAHRTILRFARCSRSPRYARSEERMLTVPAREFHGRDVELAQIRAELERLADGAEAVIVVEGAPGGNAGGLTGHRDVRHRRPPVLSLRCGAAACGHRRRERRDREHSGGAEGQPAQPLRPRLRVNRCDTSRCTDVAPVTGPGLHAASPGVHPGEGEAIGSTRRSLSANRRLSTTRLDSRRTTYPRGVAATTWKPGSHLLVTGHHSRTRTHSAAGPR